MQLSLSLICGIPCQTQWRVSRQTLPGCLEDDYIIDLIGSSLYIQRRLTVTELVKILRIDKFSDKGDRITNYWRILCTLM